MADVARTSLTIKVDGLRWPKNGFKPENLHDIQNLELKPNDIVMSVFPKAGTHWLKYTIWEILNEGKPPPLTADMNIPFVDLYGVDLFKELNTPRAMVTHVPMSRLPIREYAKYICGTRNPFDCCVSYYKFISPQIKNDSSFTFDNCFEDFLDGLNSFGDFFDHLHDWYTLRSNPNVLLVTYEDMSLDSRQCILKIARFLGDEYAQKLQSSEDITSNILKHTSFQYMKQNLDLNFVVGPPESNKKESFLRKGVVGTWKEMMSSDQKDRLMKKMKERMEDKTLLNYWTNIIESEI